MFKLEIKQSETLHTRYGTAKINNHGYYQITSRKEGNHGKKLHRLIFEDFYGPIPENCHVHHKDSNKLNNCIMNLQLLTGKQHLSMHNQGENNPMYGKERPKEVKDKISEAQKGKTFSEETKRKMSENQSKYNIWDYNKVIYDKYMMYCRNRQPNPCKCFKLRYKRKNVNIGGFIDFLTPEIIYDIIKGEDSLWK